MTTFEVRVEDFVALQEVGKVINPVLADGPDRRRCRAGASAGRSRRTWSGATAAWRNAQMTNYIMPTSMDLPPIRVFFEEVPYPNGPAGAKGIGELPMDGPARRDRERVSQDALGVRVRRAADHARAPDGVVRGVDCLIAREDHAAA